LRFRRAPSDGSKLTKLHDPPALAAGLRSSPILSVSRKGASHLLNCSSGRSSISTQRTENTARHFTDIRSVRSDTDTVQRVRGLERRYRTWYVIRPFAAFVYWLNSVLFSGDKSNHVPSLHPPQMYYFVAFATIMGWPALISGDSGLKMLVNDVQDRIFGNRRCVLIVNAWCEYLNGFPADQAHGGARSCLDCHGTIYKTFHVGAVTLERKGYP
jgi:hypothetical protein